MVYQAIVIDMTFVVILQNANNLNQVRIPVLDLTPQW